jgi:hypothetical protein
MMGMELSAGVLVWEWKRCEVLAGRKLSQEAGVQFSRTSDGEGTNQSFFLSKECWHDS